MTKAAFIAALRRAVKTIAEDMQDPCGEWTVKGFIDVHRKIYPMSPDTKLVSKVIELCLFPKLVRFAQDNHLELEPAREQNFYPDLTFRDAQGHLFALDLKSSYRKTASTINGMTLGAFTGYFRNRASTKNTMHPYGDYSTHVVLGIIYSATGADDSIRVREWTDLATIRSVLASFKFFVQEKWKIASDRPGSGNTKNIGSVVRISDLIAGKGTFSDWGEDVFDDYWTHYLTHDMAARAELSAPYYRNFEEYRHFKGLGD